MRRSFSAFVALVAVLNIVLNVWILGEIAGYGRNRRENDVYRAMKRR